MKTIGLVFSILVSGMILNSFYTSVQAHNFYQNNDSIFFTLVKKFEVEDNLASNNTDTNKSNSLKHSENAANLLKLIFFNSSISNNANFVNTYKPIFDGLNLTTKALIAANLADECLKEYGLAQGLDLPLATSLLNMTMNMGTAMKMGDNMSTPSGPTSKALKLANTQLVNNQANFETSTMLAKSLKILFLSGLKNATLEKSTGLMQIPIEMKTESVKNLGQGIDNLVSALNRKAYLQEVFSIVHGQIHPNLFLAYDLKLKSE